MALISSPCSWTIKSPDTESSVSLTKDTAHNVFSEICHELGCGQVYSLTQSSVRLNTTCFTNCVYHNYQLKNCTEVTNHSCSILSEVKCGKSVHFPWQYNSYEKDDIILIQRNVLGSVQVKDALCRIFSYSL